MSAQGRSRFDQYGDRTASTNIFNSFRSLILRCFLVLTCLCLYSGHLFVIIRLKGLEQPCCRVKVSSKNKVQQTFVQFTYEIKYFHSVSFNSYVQYSCFQIISNVLKRFENAFSSSNYVGPAERSLFSQFKFLFSKRSNQYLHVVFNRAYRFLFN